MRNLDFSSWQAVVTTLIGLLVGTGLTMGLRLLVTQTVQQRRQRENRQINERLRTLIAAYKTLGGSFTGELAVDPTHLRDLLRQNIPATIGVAGAADTSEDAADATTFDRSRRIRDAVEAALSDIILLGTQEQVELAARAATELAEGRPVHTHELVVSLRDFIRKVLDLEPVPTHLAIPKQGPTRPSGGSGSGKGKGGNGDRAGKQQDGGDGGAGGGGGGGGGMGLAEGDQEHEVASNFQRG